ncbi:hypothetical protein Dsin_011491 [Dipteronia sinensis]|uniref:Uncharacterized protein n=1 Tax=Dipteronia sinensis TaxID=43782 RepID=A0AAE0EDN3_9ROSI|nr:hypothetical protein Dsin_011491 [Dipteronia sinensis]
MEGDKNSKFYHSIYQAIRRRNFIGEMSFEGVTHTDPVHIKEGIYNFFKDHFKKTQQYRPRIRDLTLSQLSEAQSRSLEEEFNEGEVLLALNNCDGNKASGPDGLNLNFIKINWEVIKGDFRRFIKDFHRDGSNVDILYKTFIALIPKIGNPSSMKDFQADKLGRFYVQGVGKSFSQLPEERL